MNMLVLIIVTLFASANLAFALSIEDVEAAFLLEEYEDTIALSNRLLAEDPGQVDALFLQGSALMQSGDTKTAKQVLEKYLRYQEGTYLQEAREALSRSGGQEKASHDLFLQWGIVQDSRILSERNTPPFYDEESDQAIRFRLAYDYQTPAGWLARYRGYWLNYFSLPEESRFEHAIEGGYLFNSLGGSLEWTASGEYLMKDYKGDLERISTRAEQAWIVGRNRIGWMSLEIGHDTFPDTYLFDGDYFIGSIGLEDYREKLSIFYDGYIYRHEAKIDSLAYTEAGGGFVAAYQAGNKTGLGLSMRASTIQFDEVDDILLLRRKDKYFSARLWMSFEQSSNFSIVPSFEYVNNSSDADFADYDEYIGAIDMIWLR